MKNEIEKELNEIKNQLETLEKIRIEIERLRTIVESRESLIPKFVESSPSIRTYGERIKGIIEYRFITEIEQDIYIMGYFDQIMLDKLLRIAGHVRIISPRRALDNRRNLDALRRISEAGAQVRTHPMLHSRIVCIPDHRFLIVGSGDLQTDCLGGTRFDAGIYSNYPELIQSAIDFFNRVWEESDPIT